MITSRRRFLFWAGALLTAPALAKAGSSRPVERAHGFLNIPHGTYRVITPMALGGGGHCVAYERGDCLHFSGPTSVVMDVHLASSGNPESVQLLKLSPGRAGDGDVVSLRVDFDRRPDLGQ